MEWVKSSLVKSSLQSFVCVCLCVLALGRGSKMLRSSLGSREGGISTSLRVIALGSGCSQSQAEDVGLARVYLGGSLLLACAPHEPKAPDLPQAAAVGVRWPQRIESPHKQLCESPETSQDCHP